MPYPGEAPNFLSTSPPGYSKCRPSRPMIQPDNTCKAVLAPQRENNKSLSPTHETVLVTNVLIRSNKTFAELPYNVSLGTISPFTEVNQSAYDDAVNHTAKHLSDMWSTQVLSNTRGSPFSSTSPGQKPTHTVAMSSELDSSSLSQFLETTSEANHVFPPTEPVNLQPNSQEFYDKLIQALALNTPLYSQIGNAAPTYSLPYRKRTAEHRLGKYNVVPDAQSHACSTLLHLQNPASRSYANIEALYF